MITGYFLYVLEDGAFSFDEDEIFFISGSRREQDALFAQSFVVIDDVVVDAFFQDEGVVP